jgi:hypothetical protein
MCLLEVTYNMLRLTKEVAAQLAYEGTVEVIWSQNSASDMIATSTLKRERDLRLVCRIGIWVSKGREEERSGRLLIVLLIWREPTW